MGGIDLVNMQASIIMQYGGLEEILNIMCKVKCDRRKALKLKKGNRLQNIVNITLDDKSAVNVY